MSEAVAKPAPEDRGDERWPYSMSGRSAAFFDLDRTLISGASAFTFAIVAWRHGLLPGRALARDSLKAVAFRMGGASDAKAERIRAQVLDAVAGNRQADLVALNSVIVPKLLGEVRPEAKRLLDLHRDAGRDTYIVSASPAEIVEPLAQALGITGGIGTRAEVDADGVYTGELDGPFCYGPGKGEAIRELAHWEGYVLEACYAYSDSASDLPMLDLVGHPVAVNPDAGLSRLAHERGWPVVIFRRRTKAVVRRTTGIVAAGAIGAAGFAAGVALGRRMPGEALPARR